MNRSAHISHRSRAARVALVACLLLALSGSGCGMGSDSGGGGGGGKDIEPGSVVRNFQATVTSPTSARLTASLGRPAVLTLSVKKVEGSKEVSAGEVKFGRRPAGAVSLPWNLQVASRELAPGRYRLILRGEGAGRSKPTVVTVPEA